MKVTLAFDSFKGSLTSQEVAQAFEEGLHSVIPHCEIVKTIIADGGEGSVEALVSTLNGTYIDVMVCDPLGRKIQARYGIIDAGKTAIIEMASASGLTLLSPDEYNPLITSTYGTGEMIRDAIERGCSKILLCIGGSATNDGGTGMLRALGYRFTDNRGNTLMGGGEILERISYIDDRSVHQLVSKTQFVVACDVDNPLYGSNGAAHIYAPQKGADAEMVLRLDNGLRNWSKVILSYNNQDIALLPGAGAAGGLGAGCKAILQAHLQRGIDMILDAMQFETIIANSDLVITGEGCIDHQTLMGKAPYGVLQRAQSQGIDTIAIGGKVKWCDELKKSHFKAIIPITHPDTPPHEAMQREIAINNVKQAAIVIAQQYIQ